MSFCRDDGRCEICDQPEPCAGNYWRECQECEQDRNDQ